MSAVPQTSIQVPITLQVHIFRSIVQKRMQQSKTFKQQKMQVVKFMHRLCLAHVMYGTLKLIECMSQMMHKMMLLHLPY